MIKMNHLLLAKLSLTCLFSLLLTSNSYSCTCLGDEKEGFCESISPSSTFLKSEVISIGARYHSMQAKIIEIWNGQVNTDTITVLGHDGINCLESIRNFIVGDSLILLINKVSDSLYHLNGCSYRYLHFKRDSVFGYLYTDYYSELSYDEFKSDIGECIGTTTGLDVQDLKSNIRLFPNPIRSTLTIESDLNGEFDIQIYSVEGRTIFTENGNIRNRNIYMNNVIPGVYIIQLTSKYGDRYLERIVIN